jgi:outer membrane murein-binding lipoprotein Lpp
MERSSAVKQGLRVVLTSVFLAAALLTTGCGDNALMNPLSETVQDGGSLNAAKNGCQRGADRRECGPD